MHYAEQTVPVGDAGEVLPGVADAFSESPSSTAPGTAPLVAPVSYCFA